MPPDCPRRGMSQRCLLREARRALGSHTNDSSPRRAIEPSLCHNCRRENASTLTWWPELFFTDPFGNFPIVTLLAFAHLRRNPRALVPWRARWPPFCCYCFAWQGSGGRVAGGTPKQPDSCRPLLLAHRVPGNAWGTSHTDHPVVTPVIINLQTLRWAPQE